MFSFHRITLNKSVLIDPCNKIGPELSIEIHPGWVIENTITATVLLKSNNTIFQKLQNKFIYFFAGPFMLTHISCALTFVSN